MIVGVFAGTCCKIRRTTKIEESEVKPQRSHKRAGIGEVTSETREKSQVNRLPSRYPNMMVVPKDMVSRVIGTWTSNKDNPKSQPHNQDPAS